MHILAGIIPPKFKSFAKRSWQMYFAHIAQQLNELHQGVVMYHAGLGKALLVRVNLLFTCTDSRAHPKITGFSQSPAINGACPYCYVVGFKPTPRGATLYCHYSSWLNPAVDNDTLQKISEDIKYEKYEPRPIARSVASTEADIDNNLVEKDGLSPVLSSFNVVNQNILCLMHVLKNVTEDLYLVMGNESNKKIKKSTLDLEHKYNRFTNFKNESNAFPFHMTSKNKKEFATLLSSIQFPYEVGELRNPFVDSGLKSHNWLLLGGQFGATIINRFINNAECLVVYQRLFIWIQEVTSSLLTESMLNDLEQTLPPR